MKNERGIALVVALLVMSLLSLLGTTFLAMAMTESMIATNLVHEIKAFNIAEAGLEHARTVIVKSKSGGIVGILASGKIQGFGPSVPYAGGTYTVTVRNNCKSMNGIAADITGCTPAGVVSNVTLLTSADTDGNLILTSIGRYEKATKTISTLVRLQKSDPVITSRVLAWWEGE